MFSRTSSREWSLPPRPASSQAFIADALARQGIDRQQLTRHADRGTSMTFKQVAQLLVDPGVGSGCAAELDPSLRVVVAEEVSRPTSR